MKDIRSESPKFEAQLLRYLAFLPWAIYLLSPSPIPQLYNGKASHPHRVAMEIKRNNAFKVPSAVPGP